MNLTLSGKLAFSLILASIIRLLLSDYVNSLMNVDVAYQVSCAREMAVRIENCKNDFPATGLCLGIQKAGVALDPMREALSPYLTMKLSPLVDYSGIVNSVSFFVCFFFLSLLKGICVSTCVFFCRCSKSSECASSHDADKEFGYLSI